MQFEADTLDDLLLNIFPVLLSAPQVTTTRETSRECIGVSLRLNNPRARLSRSVSRGKAFSCLGELVWYLSGSNSLKQIERYIKQYRDESEDNETIYGAYGPRLLGVNGYNHNQIQNVIKLLSERSTSRRAVIQLFDARDISGETRRTEIPCTVSLQFLSRDGKLHMVSSMRSNDALKGLPHDIFCFTMIQEIIARSLNVDVGMYHHFVGSLHLYEHDVDKAQFFVNEHYQQRISMPEMPVEDPWPSIQCLIKHEELARKGEPFDPDSATPHPYWADILRLLQIYFSNSPDEISTISDSVKHDEFKYYIKIRKQQKINKSQQK